PSVGAPIAERGAAIGGATIGGATPRHRRGRVPARIRRAVLRGLAAEPGARHASMTALVAVLARRPRRALIAVPVAAAAVSIVVWSRVPVADPQCGGAA